MGLKTQVGNYGLVLRTVDQAAPTVDGIRTGGTRGICIAAYKFNEAVDPPVGILSVPTDTRTATAVEVLTSAPGDYEVSLMVVSDWKGVNP